ncbi:MAG: XdhC family protein [Alphaproteobacteria bacterium]
MTDTQMLDHDNVLERAAAWKAEGGDVALATVVTTWGSSPRPVGSQLAIRGDGSFVGSVSGGCIEGAVITEAMNVMQDGSTKVLDFGVTDEMAWEVGLACGGKISVFVEHLD